MITQTDNLPKNAIEGCEYVGQDVCSTEIDPEMAQEYGFDAEQALLQPVEFIRMDYPFEVTPPASYNVYKIPVAKTWGELVKAIKEVCIREYAAGHNAACHALEDYIIEGVLIHPNNAATVMIGS